MKHLRNLTTLGSLLERKVYLATEQKDILKEIEECPNWHKSALQGALLGNRALVRVINERIKLQLHILTGLYDGQ